MQKSHKTIQEGEVYHIANLR